MSVVQLAKVLLMPSREFSTLGEARLNKLVNEQKVTHREHDEWGGGAEAGHKQTHHKKAPGLAAPVATSQGLCKGNGPPLQAYMEKNSSNTSIKSTHYKGK